MLSLGIIKPDAVRRRLTGAILSQIEGAGYVVRAMAMLKLSEYECRELYKAHLDREYWPRLLETMTSGPVVVFVVDQSLALDNFRDFALQLRDRFIQNDGNAANNVIHSSEEEDRFREISIFFPLSSLNDSMAT